MVILLKSFLEVFFQVFIFSLCVILFKSFAKFWGFEKIDLNDFNNKEIKKEKFKIEILNKIPKNNFHIFSYLCLVFLVYFIYVNFQINSRDFYISDNPVIDEGNSILLRLMLTTLASLVIYKEFKINNQSRWIIVFGIIALIFNPIKMVIFSDWLLIDFATFCLILLYLFKNKFNLPCGQ